MLFGKGCRETRSTRVPETCNLLENTGSQSVMKGDLPVPREASMGRLLPSTATGVGEFGPSCKAGHARELLLRPLGDLWAHGGSRDMFRVDLAVTHQLPFPRYA